MIIPKTDAREIHLDDIKGLIIIDCWDISPVQQWIDSNKTRFNIDYFDSILVANYDLKLDSNDISQYNVLKQYSWTDFTPSILLSMTKHSRMYVTHPWILNQFNDRTFLILEPNDMIHHVQHVVPHVQDWLVVGYSWLACTHQRPLGFNNLQFMPYNFYITNWSMIGQNPDSLKHIEQDHLCWIDQGNNLFQLGKYATR